MDLSNTYWSSNGLFTQDTVDKLSKLIPQRGKVINPRKNRKLEKFRKAQNCYYDLYNNGLCNRTREFREVFGIASSKYMWKRPNGYGKDISDELRDLTEEAMDAIILEACDEQGIKSEVSL